MPVLLPHHRPPTGARRSPLLVPVYPVAFALAFVVGAFFESDISIHAAIRPFLIVLVAGSLLTVLAVVTLGSTRGPVGLTLAILVARTVDARHLITAGLLLVIFVATWMVARRFQKIRSRLDRPTALLNLVSAFLMLAIFVSAALSGALWRIDLTQGRPLPGALGPAVDVHRDRPDIYLILLDGYPRADTLTRLFDADNAPFVQHLRDRGFDVADASSSNYMYTAMSLASMLHMNYVQDLSDGAVVSTPYGASLRMDINHNPVWTRLRALGYEIVANQAPWENVAMRQSDLFCGGEVNDLELYLLRTTLIGSVVNLFDPSFVADQHRAAIKLAFDCLGKASAPTTSPRAVFIHVGGPHLPIVFDASGGPAALDVFGDTAHELAVPHDRFVSAYVAEVEYLNRRVLEAVDELLRRPDHPIIVVWSDHGSESRLDAHDAMKSDFAERFSNFFAARAPGMPRLFPADITPVNIFPTLFNAYFGTDLPLRVPRQFVSSADEKLNFTEVPDPDTQP